MPEYWKHQIEMARMMWSRPRFGNFAKPGAGKTRPTCRVIANRVERGDWDRVLVVTFLRLCAKVWPVEMMKWAMEIAVRNLHRERRLGPEPVHVINFESFKPMVKAGLLKPEDWDALIVDESSKMKSMKSQITRALLAFGQGVENVYLMSGTPAPNSPVEFFPQIQMLKPGKIRNFYAARACWMEPTGWGDWKGKGNNWKLKDGVEEKFMAWLTEDGELARFYDKPDELQLPPLTFVPVPVTLSDQELWAYQEMEEHLLTQLADGAVKAINQLVKRAKLRQLADGWAYADGDLAGRTGDSKLTTTLGLIDEELEGRSVLCIHAFREQAMALVRALGDRAHFVDSEKTETERLKVIAGWEGKEFPVLVAHPLSCGHGLNWGETCSEMIWLSPSDSLEGWEQTIARINRPGQEHPMTVYLMEAEETLEGEMYDALKKKERLAERLKRIAQKRLTACHTGQ